MAEEVEAQLFSAEGKETHRHQAREGASGCGAAIRIMWKPVWGPVRTTFHPLLALAAREMSLPVLSPQKFTEVETHRISDETQKSVKQEISSHTKNRIMKWKPTNQNVWVRRPWPSFLLRSQVGSKIDLYLSPYSPHYGQKIREILAGETDLEKDCLN